jgi:hypothetical protein
MRVRRNTGVKSVGAKHSVLAVTLVFALLAGIFPFNLFASGELCTMSCCAMRGPHTLASHCSGSVCHLNPLQPKEGIEITRQEPAAQEHLTAPQVAAHSPSADHSHKAESVTVTARHSSHNWPSKPKSARTKRIQSDAHHPQLPVSINAVVMTSGCPRSCGAVTAYSFNQHRQSEPAMSAALTPPTSQSSTTFSPALLSSILQQQFPPRAPPFTLY